MYLVQFFVGQCRNLKMNEWIVQTVKSMYDNAHSKVRIPNCCSNPIIVSVKVHQGSVLSPHHFYGSPILQVQNWLPVGATLFFL